MFNFFKRFFKESPVLGSVLSFYSPGQAIWTPENYEDLVREGYKINPYVYRSVNLIASAVATMPVVLYREVGDSIVEVSDSPLLSIVGSRGSANPVESWQNFVRASISFYCLTGNAYILKVGANEGPPRELYWLRPDYTQVLAGNSKQLVSGYQYQASGNKIELKAESVLHMKTWNPTDDFYGMSPLIAGSRSVDQSNLAKSHNVSLLQNSAKPSGVLEVKDSLTKNELTLLKDEITNNWAGPLNNGRPVLLTGNTTWKQIGLSNVELDWLQGQKMASKEIALIYGVPPEMIGDTESKTYASYGEARLSFYEETAIPLASLFYAHLNTWLTPSFGRNLFLAIDEDRIQALEAKRAIKFKTAIDAVNAGLLTINEGREMVGYGRSSGCDIFRWQLGKGQASSK